MKENELDTLRKQNAELLQKLRIIADDFHPDNDAQAPLALSEMRAAINQIWENAQPAATAAQSAPASAPDWFSYDAANDVLTIHGIRYSGELMRDFSEAMPCGQPFEIVERERGILAVRRLDRTAAANAGGQEPMAEATIDEIGQKYGTYSAADGEWTFSPWEFTQAARDIAEAAINANRLAAEKAVGQTATALPNGAAAASAHEAYREGLREAVRIINTVDDGEAPEYRACQEAISNAINNALAADTDGLTDAERRFVELVKANPGRKLCWEHATADDVPLWRKPEALGLIECVGSYKWRPAAVGAGGQHD